MISSVNAPSPLDVFAAASATTPRRPAPAPSPTASASASVTVDSLPASPPPEVLAEMHTAATAYDRLAAEGRQLRFSTDPGSGRVTAAITDSDGNVTSSVSLRDVLAIAAGATLS